MCSSDNYILETVGLSKIYDGVNSSVTAISDVTFKIRHGEFIAVVGPSGSGKTTLMNMLGCLDYPSRGECLFCGKDYNGMTSNEKARLRRDEIGFIFQQYNLVQSLSVEENVELPLIYSGLKYSQRKKKIREALEKVSLYGKRGRFPNELSGGQQQKAAVARALALAPSLVLADEPTGALDLQSGKDILNLLTVLNDEGVTVIIVTHNMDIAKIAERIITIEDGRIVGDIQNRKSAGGEADE